MDNEDSSILRVEENGVEFFTVVATGESASSERGLAAMAGVDREWLRRISKDLALGEAVFVKKRLKNMALTWLTKDENILE